MRLYYYGYLLSILLGSNFGETIKGKIGEVYIRKIDYSNSFTIEFSKEQLSPHQPARVHAHKIYTSDDADNEDPVFVVIRQERDVVSWELPYLSENGQLYNFASRSTCPYENDSLVVIVSTPSVQGVKIEVHVGQQTFYKVPLNSAIRTHAAPTAPRYFRFDFPQGVDNVLLEVTSPNDTCASLSLFKSCSIHQLVEFSTHRDSYRQTITRNGGMMINRKMFVKGYFYIGFVVFSDDQQCLDDFIQPDLNGSIILDSVRVKNLTLSFRDISHVRSSVIVMATCGFFLILALLGTIAWAIYSRCCKEKELHVNEENNTDDLLQPKEEELNGDAGDSTATAGPSNIQNETVISPGNGEKLYLSDLMWYDSKELTDPKSFYSWILVAIIIYNGIPVIYMVIVYQLNIHKTGDMDWCYYNFYCSHPLMFLSDFNHVASNIGYGFLGLIFIFIVKQRHNNFLSGPLRYHYLGVPQQFDLFYTMGWALFAECICSSCYHVCPNRFNFQIDTCFMYVIAVMCGIKLYQKRHPCGAMDAKNAFFFLAILNVISWLGELLGNYLITWIVFSLLYLCVNIFCCVHVYYSGCWKFRKPTKTLFREISANNWCIKYKDRFTYTTIIFGLNFILLVFGLVVRPDDFASHLLAILIANLFVCTVVYLVVKSTVEGNRQCCCCNCLFCCRLKPVILLVISVCFWVPAVYFFGLNSSAWEETPAVSRTFNKHCKLLDFFDYHDLWHLLSSFGLFFYFWFLLIIDDDLKETLRSKIQVIL
ncbi:SID1 transmembrane family member 1-like isoform X2 [Neocloeon triangulifer]|uniref:SID1 transmembrane family member 1-like isoform X2 n=1 Tax=Neocloeon triangulifer TaxID=2078957 RepID=UPI00286F9E12|nr:SID1 transmembrane family member 1-like isoform X2 [Neocloeon triangulifer]